MGPATQHTPSEFRREQLRRAQQNAQSNHRWALRQAQMRATEGLVMRRRPVYGTMQLVPPDPTPDAFQKYMLGVIEKVKDTHEEVFGRQPKTIELGTFLQKRLRPWIESREVTELRLAKAHEEMEIIYDSLDNPVRIAETVEVQVTKDFLRGMVIQEHPEETWIDIPE